MIRIKYLTAAALLSFVLMGCSTNKNVVPDLPQAEIYNLAKTKLQSGNFKGAITELEALDSRYPFGPYSLQTQLDLIYAYYKSGDLAMAQTSIDRFIRLNPLHANIDYVLYMKGLTEMAFDENFLQDLFRIDRSDRSIQHARNAFQDFGQLITTYPDSIYANDAYRRMVFLKDKLAKHELAIAQYYLERGAYVAVVNRVEQMIRDFPDTQATIKALPLMEKAYIRLNLTNQAQNTAKLIAANQIAKNN